MQLNTTEGQAALLLEMLAEKAKTIPSGLPERAEWLGLARQVADSLVAGIIVEERGGRGV